MCGIAGFLGYNALSTVGVPHVLQRMGEAVYHRGPDDSGIWCDDRAQVGLVHRRLSVLDLSPAGHQPMESASGRYVIVFNGEIYNHLDLRHELSRSHSGGGLAWKGDSDTETLLAVIDAWGFEETLPKIIGMFALALWDRAEQALYLARDRMGEKPLYYGWKKDVFLFGSELKALRTHPAFEGEIDRNSIVLQMRYGYIPAPYSIYRDISKLLPGHYLKVRVLGGREGSECLPYWSLKQVAERGFSDPFIGTDVEAVGQLDTLLSSAVAQQLIADVPLGAFLSGGIDSSVVVALMQSQSTSPVKTFTIGFNEVDRNEAKHARAVADHLGTEHTELYVTPRHALDVIPRLPFLYDEPFSDCSQIPTYLVSELARRRVTVALSGDAGDELFGGYDRYHRANHIWSKISRVPMFLRRAARAGLTSLSPSQWNQLFRWVPGGGDRLCFGDKIHKGAAMLDSQTLNEFYMRLITQWKGSDSVVINGIGHSTQTMSSQVALNGFFEQMMLLDSFSYLPDDILCKVDRASMGVSLETRVPMLDHRVIEFAWCLPLHLKVRDGRGKWILRQVLYKYLPKELVDRPKMGFGVPIDSWLRGSLRDWAESLLDESRLSREGYFNPVPIRQKWSEYLAGQSNSHHYLWGVLMFQAWLEGEK